MSKTSNLQRLSVLKIWLEEQKRKGIWMKIDGGALEFFQSIPDDMLTQIAFYDRDSLERLCVALTLDVQIIIEEAEREKNSKKKKKNLAS